MKFDKKRLRTAFYKVADSSFALSMVATAVFLQKEMYAAGLFSAVVGGAVVYALNRSASSTIRDIEKETIEYKRKMAEIDKIYIKKFILLPHALPHGGLLLPMPLTLRKIAATDTPGTREHVKSTRKAGRILTPDPSDLPLSVGLN